MVRATASPTKHDNRPQASANPCSFLIVLSPKMVNGPKIKIRINERLTAHVARHLPIIQSIDLRFTSCRYDYFHIQLILSPLLGSLSLSLVYLILGHACLISTQGSRTGSLVIQPCSLPLLSLKSSILSLPLSKVSLFLILGDIHRRDKTKDEAKHKTVYNPHFHPHNVGAQVDREY